MRFYEDYEYQPKCLKLFNNYKNIIEGLMPFARVEHIGSSSVPGAISKGDLDIFVGVDTDKMHITINTIKDLGFKEKKNTLRTPELCMLESETEDVAVQVISNGSEFEFFIFFRDKLCSSKKLVLEYNSLKKSCEGMDEDEYRRIKSRFIEKVLSATVSEH